MSDDTDESNETEETERERIHDGWQQGILVYIVVGAFCLLVLSTCTDCTVKLHIKIEQATPAPSTPK